VTRTHVLQGKQTSSKRPYQLTGPPTHPPIQQAHRPEQPATAVI